MKEQGIKEKGIDQRTSFIESIPLSKKIMTAEMVGNYLHVSSDKIRKLANEGRIKGYKEGQEWRFFYEDVLKYIETKKEETYKIFNENGVTLNK